MDAETRALLRKRHAKHLAEQSEKAAAEAVKAAEAAEAEKAAEAAKAAKAEAERLAAIDENTQIDLFFAGLSETFSTLSQEPDLELSLEMIACGIDSIIELIKLHNRMGELKMIVERLVEVLTKMHENVTKTATQVRKIKEIVQHIFTMCEVEIEIQDMDTSADEETAKKFQANEWGDHEEHPFYDGATGGGGGVGGGGACGGGGFGGQALPTDDAGGMPPLEAYPNEVAIGGGNVIAQTGEH